MNMPQNQGTVKKQLKEVSGNVSQVRREVETKFHESEFKQERKTWHPKVSIR